MARTVLGIIGGSGVYDIPGLEHARWERLKGPWGEASEELLFGTFKGVDLVFLPRHGRGHVQTPTSINYRANIDALKRAGVTDVISVSACGSLREELPPGTFVIVDQFIDRTFARENLLRTRLRRACLDGAADLSQTRRRARRGVPRGENPSRARRHIPRHG